VEDADRGDKDQTVDALLNDIATLAARAGAHFTPDPDKVRRFAAAQARSRSRARAALERPIAD